MSIIWHNGAFTDDTAIFTAHDRMRLGECVFNTMLAVNDTIIRATPHFEKLLNGAKIYWGETPAPPATVDSLLKAGHDLLKRNGFLKGRHAVNTIITRGNFGNGIKPPENPHWQIVMRALPALDTFPPVHAIIAASACRNEGSPLSQIKCGNYGENILALREAMDKGANDAIMLNNKGRIACATTSNIFIVQDGKLVTPPLSEGAQNGITRKLVLERLNGLEKPLTPEDLHNAEGIYLTNSLRGVVPVISLDGQPLPPPSLGIDKDFHLT